MRVWVILELDQVSRPGSGNVSLPRVQPNKDIDESEADDLSCPVQFSARYVCEKTDVMDEMLLVVFSEPWNAYEYIAEYFVDGDDIAVLEVLAKELLHRAFRGDWDGLCVLDPRPFAAAIAGRVENHELVAVPTTIGELVERT